MAAEFKSYTTLENEMRPSFPETIQAPHGIFLEESQYVWPSFLVKPPPPPPPPPVPKRQKRKDLPKAVDHTCLIEQPQLSGKSSYFGSTNDEEIKYRSLKGKSLVECAVIDCHVIDCNAKDCCFTNCTIVGGTLKDVELIKCEVWKSNLDDMSSTNSKFSECDIHEAELKSCCFLDCKIKSCETKFSIKAQSTRFTDCTINLATDIMLLSKQCKFIMCGGSGVPEAESDSDSDEEWGVQGNVNAEPSAGVLIGNQPPVAQDAPPLLPDNYTQ